MKMVIGKEALSGFIMHMFVYQVSSSRQNKDTCTVKQ